MLLELTELIGANVADEGAAILDFNVVTVL